MERTSTFLDDLAEVVQNTIIVRQPDEDIVVEARANQWSFSMTCEQAARIEPHQIVAFITTIVQAREAALLARYGAAHPMILYCWFDEQAVQLRFSLVSAHHHALPFGCRLQHITDLTRIAERFLSSPDHDGLIETPVSDSDASPPQAARESVDGSLEVWSVRLPRISSVAADYAVIPGTA